MANSTPPLTSKNMVVKEAISGLDLAWKRIYEKNNPTFPPKDWLTLEQIAVLWGCKDTKARILIAGLREQGAVEVNKFLAKSKSGSGKPVPIIHYKLK